jgi:hypothetical protein
MIVIASAGMTILLLCVLGVLLRPGSGRRLWPEKSALICVNQRFHNSRSTEILNSNPYYQAQDRFLNSKQARITENQSLFIDRVKAGLKASYPDRFRNRQQPFVSVMYLGRRARLARGLLIRGNFPDVSHRCN